MFSFFFFRTKFLSFLIQDNKNQRKTFIGTHIFIPCLCIILLSFFFLHQCWDDKEGRKQMSKNNARGLTTLRQRLRRHNRDYENEIKKYREVTSFVGFLLFWISESLIELKNHFYPHSPQKIILMTITW